jgi:hypothetical protein
MSRNILDFPVSIRISNEYFVGYSDVKIPANSIFELFFGQNKEKVPIIIIKNINNETIYCYEEDEFIKELRLSYWNFYIFPYKIIIKNDTESPVPLNDINLKIYLTNEHG